jgi:O-antigen/teichoic acid export membrane protein
MSFFAKISALFTDRNRMILGGLLAQLSLFACIPLILRVYPASSVAQWSLLLTWVNLLWSFVQLKTDQALVQASDDIERKQLFSIGLWSAGILGFGILTLAYCAGWIEDFRLLGWMVLALLLHGRHQMNLSWLLSMHQFRMLSNLRILQALLAYPAALLGAQGLGQEGLLICFCFSNAFCILMALFGRFTPRISIFIGLINLKQLYLKHQNTFTYLAGGNMLLSVADQAMVLLIAHFFDPISGAAYFMAARICNLPLSLIQSGLGQYNLRWFQDLYAQGQLKPMVPIRFWLKWLPWTALYFLPILLAGPTLFAWILGENWRLSGQIAVLLGFSAALRLLTNPTSMGYFVMGRPAVFFNFCLLLLGVTLLCGCLAWQNVPVFGVLGVFVFLQIIILVFYNLLMLRMMQRA